MSKSFTDNNKLTFTTLAIKRDIRASNNYIVVQRGQQSTKKSNSGGPVNFSTPMTSTTTLKAPTDYISEKKGFLDKDNDLEATSKQQRKQFPRVTYDEEDKYCIEIKDGFMKVSMKPASTLVNKVVESPDEAIGPSTVKAVEENQMDFSNNQGNGRIDSQTRIPETVLQFQRQLRKTQAAKRASTPLAESQLQIVYDDEHIVVVNKPSGVLTVPGINSNPSMLSLLYEKYKEELDPEMKPEHMIVHRLDMDTSGIVVYAKSKRNLLRLQELFRNRDEVSKCYEAVVCGHLHPEIQRGSIDLPL